MRRALIVAPNWIGDAVMAQPLLSQLKKQGFIIDVVATPWVAPIFQACSEVSQTIEADFKHGALGLKLRIALAKQLKLHQYDAAYILPNSWKSALLPWLAKIPVRIGYIGELRFGLITKSLPNPPKKNRPSMVAHYAALANIGISQNNISENHHPDLIVSAQERTNAHLIAKNFLPQCDSFFILAPGAEYGPAKQWPLEHFAQLAINLIKAFPNTGIFITGSQKDWTNAQQIIDQTTLEPEIKDRVKNLCGQISLSQSIALISIAKGIASNDSGMMHVAAAFGIAQVAFFGSSDPKHTPPLSPYANALWLGLDCSPCHQRQCPLGHLKCLRDISPQLAFESLSKKISEKEG